ncbi:MAG: CRISPR-associated DxTHG motif protein [Candidatus Riflebacteria bacterium]|nr:CRISPR-associated DxTHG motif protein [Candidatus Riflebacteria bacterium]
MKNVLLASYGYRKNGELYPEIEYSFNGKSYTSRYFFIALQNLLDIEFDKIILFLTKDSRSAYENYIREYLSNDLLEIADISDGKTIEEIWKLFDGVVNQGDKLDENEKVNVYLDITNGFRHLPLVLYNSLSYLESLNKVKIQGIYYGALEAKHNNIIPVFDLTNLAKILRGGYAVKQFEESGNIIGIKDFVNDAITENSRENSDCPARNKVNLDFEELQDLISAGLPLESGLIAKKFCDYKYVDSGVNSINKLIQRIVDNLKSIAASKSGKDKKKIILNEQELERTLNFVKNQLEAHNISNALVVLREWVISRIIFEKGLASKWLEHKTRDNVEKQLGYWINNLEKIKDMPCYELLSEFYSLGDRRNEYAHAGYRDKRVEVNTGKEKAKEFYELCFNNLSNGNFWKLPDKLPGNGTVLITPMGASSGLLFTAVNFVKADSIIVLTSEKFIPKVSEACTKAGLTDMSKVHILTIKDAFCGFNEAEELYKQMTEFIRNPEEININLTGGTTAMQWAMQTAYEKLIKEGINVKRIAFVDRRSTIEQQSNPYVLGELLDVERLIQQ